MPGTHAVPTEMDLDKLVRQLFSLRAPKVRGFQKPFMSFEAHNY